VILSRAGGHRRKTSDQQTRKDRRSTQQCFSKHSSIPVCRPRHLWWQAINATRRDSTESRFAKKLTATIIGKGECSILIQSHNPLHSKSWIGRQDLVERPPSRPSKAITQRRRLRRICRLWSLCRTDFQMRPSPVPHRDIRRPHSLPPRKSCKAFPTTIRSA